MKYSIITGTSSGLGEALAEQAILQQHKVFCISRKINNRLKEQSAEMRAGLWYFEQDLTNLSDIPDLMQEIFSFIDPDLASSINLINNAGVVEPVGPLGKLKVEDISGHISINLLAPIVLTNEFIKRSKEFTCRKNIVNITSGAAQNPYYGWSMYCTSKSGLDMLTRTGGLEQAEEQFPVRILSVAPGVIDTPMQEKIRQINPENFPMKPKFEKLHREGKLVDPNTAAKNILALLDSSEVKGGQITDLRR